MSPQATTKPQLLLVEDDASTQAALVRLLRTAYDVVALTSAEEALQRLQQIQAGQRGPDLIISDYSLPERSGLDFLEQCRQKSPDSVRILLTGHVVSEELSAALKAGVCHRIFLKPWENTVLLLQLQEALQQAEILRTSREWEARSSTDGLTGLFNQKFFDESLLKEVERAARHLRPLSTILLDLDQFKEINDERGHAAGNRALILVAEVLKQSLRAIDLSARVGGDEFGVILPDTPIASAREIAERIRTRVEDQAKAEAFDLSISLGVAGWRPDESRVSAEGLRQLASGLFQVTDQALYEAKRNGKNQTVIAEFQTGPLESKE